MSPGRPCHISGWMRSCQRGSCLPEYYRRYASPSPRGSCEHRKGTRGTFSPSRPSESRGPRRREVSPRLSHQGSCDEGRAAWICPPWHYHTGRADCPVLSSPRKGRRLPRQSAYGRSGWRSSVSWPLSPRADYQYCKRIGSGCPCCRCPGSTPQTYRCPCRAGTPRFRGFLCV